MKTGAEISLLLLNQRSANKSFLLYNPYVDLDLLSFLHMNRQLGKPYFLFLLPLFFVLHVCAENPGLVPVSLGLSIFLEFTLVGLLLAFLFRFIIKDFRKAAFVALFIIAFDIFFGSFQDFLFKYFNNTWLVKYSVIIAVTILLIILLTAWLKKTSRSLRRATYFINVLLLLFILIDIVSLTSFTMKKREPSTVDLSGQLSKCDTCKKPDIYLIITDGYAGDTALREYFNFDNSPFENALQQRGFHIVKNPKSNYNFTVYTLASMFNLDYIRGLDAEKMVTQQDIYLNRDIISKNNFTDYLKETGYDIENYSFMSPGGTKSRIRLSYFPPKRALFTAQTFLNRFTRSVGYHFPFYTKIFYRNIRNGEYNNNLMDSLLKRTAAIHHPQPRFIFSQLILPHHPYYYDSLGNRRTNLDQSTNIEQEKRDYVSYLVYTNKRLLSLVDTIRLNSKKPPVIMLMSDHGYRRFSHKKYDDYQFMTLNTILLPGKNYSGFYDGMSNVNQLRVLLNTQFGQRLPMIKDSTIFFIEP
jgi:hypothetical protein